MRPVSRSSVFFRAIGGVAFEAVAVSERGLAVSKLTYDATKPDGQRLLVTLKNIQRQNVAAVADIYDWQWG